MTTPTPERVDAERMERILAAWEEPDSGLLTATWEHVRCRDFAATIRRALRERDELAEALAGLLAQADACTYIGSDGNRYCSYIETATLPEIDAAIASARALLDRHRGGEAKP